MKFINSNGEIEEGFALTEAQAKQHSQILKILHEKICGGGKHYSFQRSSNEVKCEALANYFITNFTLVPVDGGSFQGEVHEAVKESDYVAVDVPPIPAPADVHALTAEEMF